MSVAPEGGVVQNSGQSVSFNGEVTLQHLGHASGSSECDWNELGNLRQALQHRAIDLRYSFPDVLSDVSADVTVVSTTRQKISFRFVSATGLDPQAANTFTAEVYENGGDLAHLQSVRGKLLLNIQALQYAIDHHSRSPHPLRWALLPLQQLLASIDAQLSQSPELIAMISQPLLVDNRMADALRKISRTGPFSQSLQFDVGAAFQGTQTAAHATITQVEDQDTTGARRFASQFYWKGAQVGALPAQDFDPGTSVTFDLPSTAPLLPSANNLFLARLISSPGSSVWAEQSQILPVVNDAIAPVWSAGTPLAGQALYARSLQPIAATVSDPFGRLDMSGFQAQLNSTDVTPLLQFVSSNQGISATITGDLNTAQGTELPEGLYQLTLNARDLAGNPSSAASPQIRIDRTPPTVVLATQDHLLTRVPELVLPIQITDASPVTTQISVNGTLAVTDTLNTLSPLVNLTDGLNTIEIAVTDAAGNTSTQVLTDITLDRTAPTLTQMTPAPGAILSSLDVSIAGTSNESLQAAVVRTNSTSSQTLSLSPDHLSFAGTLHLPAEGTYSLTLELMDLAGNVSTFSAQIEVVLRLLAGNLITVSPNPDRVHLDILGAPGAARAGLTIQAQGSFLNRASAVAAANGAFTITLDPFTQAEITTTDPALGRSDLVTVTFGSNAPTLLSGVVKDTDGHPLAGVAVGLRGSSAQVLTDASGMFSFENGVFGPNVVPTGDQQLIVDGSVLGAVAIANGPVVTFSKEHLTVFIGLNQTNVLPAPVYLQGIPTSVAPVDNSAQAITVAAANDSSVELHIPAASAQFPDGTHTGAIYMNRTTADVVAMPVPGYSQPDTVVHLEPSGLTFSERAELVLPNENNLPPGVKLVILSMNPTKGIWEIDGLAQVSTGGNEVRTLPGAGISHFSTVYASPLGPKVSNIGAADIPGADAFNGALTTQIKLPSQKVLGQDVAPTLLYKSSWARPTAMVSNLFQIPRMEVNYTSSVIGGAFGLIYNSLFEDEFHSWYQPNHIVGTFETAGIKGQPVTFAGPPNSVRLSYATELKSPTTGEFMSSSVYPYTSHWDVYLEHVVTHTSRRRDPATLVPISYSETNFPNEVQQIEQAFPSDLAGTILVENQRTSAVGSGWKIGGVQRIANPADGRVMIQEGDGSLSTYAVANTIETVVDTAPTDIDLAQGVDLSQLPLITATSSNGAIGTATIAQVQTESPTSSFDFTAYAALWSGNIWGQEFKQAGAFNAGYECDWDRYAYTITGKTQNLMKVNDTTFYATSDNESVLNYYSTTIGTGVASGLWTTAPTFQYGGYQNSIANFCNSIPGMSCPHAQHIDKDGWPGTAFDVCHNNNSDGPVPVATFNGDSYTYSTAWNHPMGMSAGPRPNTLVVADYGNFRVRLVDLITAEVTTIAGDGGYYPTGWPDSGDGGPATAAHVYHPKGVVYDAIGNLYISEESGAIRKVDTLGNISTIVGGPDATPHDALTPANQVSLNNPYGMAVDNTRGYLYIAETTGNTIKRLNLLDNTITTIAGNGQSVPVVNRSPALPIGDGGAALNATLSRPTHLGVDGSGNLYIVDSGYNRIRRMSFNAQSGSTLAYAPTAQDHSTLVRNSDGTFVRAFRNGTQVTFNADGTQAATSDRLGRSTQYTYDGTSAQRLLQITYPTGQYTRFSYAGNQLASISDSSGRTGANLSHDSSGRLTAVAFADGTQKHYGYDALGLMTSETNEMGNTAQYAYNEWNRLTTVTLPDAAHSVITINDSASATAANHYDGSQTPSAFGGPGQVADKIVDPRSSTTEFSKDKRGFISTIVDALGSKVTIERDARGKPTLLTRYDAQGNQLSQVTYEYDSNNSNPARQDDLLSQTDTATGITTSQTYDDLGNVLTRTNGRGFTSTSTYDPVTGLLLGQTDPLGRSASQTYNALGLVATKTDALGLTTTYNYDTHGNLTSVVSPTGATSMRTLDAAGNAISATDANGKITLSTYDAFNRLTSVTTPNGKTTTYVYNALGKLASVTDPMGKVATYTYDALGNLTQKVDPLGNVLTRTYDASGNVVGEIDPNGNHKTFIYDAANRLTQKLLPDNTITLSYDARGNVTSAQDQLTQVNQTYDVAGRVISAQVLGIGALSSLPPTVINYGYDTNNNRVSMSSTLGTTTYAYDDVDRLSALTNPNGQTFGFQFDGGSRLTGITRPGSTTTYSWDNSNFLTGISHQSGTGVLASFGYQLDLVGNRTAITTPRGTASASYDANYQLTALSNPEVSSSFASETFGYDDNANRVTDQNGNYAYDSAYQRLVQDWQNFYFYDNNGNLISKQGMGLNGHVTAYRYSSENQLIGFTEYAPSGIDPSGYIAVPSNPVKEVRYFYDATGRRVRKEVNDLLAPSDVTRTFARQYVYDGQEILGEYDGSGSLLARFTHSGLRTDDVLAVQVTSAGASAQLASAAGSYQYLKDAQGTVTDIADSSGNKLQHYIYSAFGILLGIQDANAADISANPVLNTSYGYTGREKDSESGLMYYRARYYDPNVGRFLQRDPEPGTLTLPVSVINAHSYVANTPLNLVDPSGKIIWFIAIPLLFAIAGSISGGIWAALQPGATAISILAGAGLGLLGGALGGAGAVGGLFAAAAIGGVAAGSTLVATAGSLIGTTTGAIAAGLGSAIAGGLFNLATGGGWIGALVGFGFGFAGGAIAGGGTLPTWVDVGTGAIVSAPPIPTPAPTTTQQPLPPWHPPLIP